MLLQLLRTALILLPIYILVVGEMKEPIQAFLVPDEQVIMEVEFKDIPFILMSAFFIFNIYSYYYYADIPIFYGSF